jgi:hypothetical protein
MFITGLLLKYWDVELLQLFSRGQAVLRPRATKATGLAVYQTVSLALAHPFPKKLAKSLKTRLPWICRHNLSGIINSQGYI